MTFNRVHSLGPELPRNVVNDSLYVYARISATQIGNHRHLNWA